MLKSVALTVAVLALGGVALGHFVIGFVTISTAWLAAVLSVAIGLGLVVALVLLAAPTTSLVASFFFDEIAALVEHEIDPTVRPAARRRCGIRRSPPCASPP